MKLATNPMPMKPLKYFFYIYYNKLKFSRPISHKSKLKNQNPHIHKTMLGKRKPINVKNKRNL